MHLKKKKKIGKKELIMTSKVIHMFHTEIPVVPYTCDFKFSKQLQSYLTSVFVYLADSKILILGAGMSGISAAKRLKELGYTNFLQGWWSCPARYPWRFYS